MSKRLINSNVAFRGVYAIYRHEYLGILISSHVVQEMDSGRLSLRHQGLYPGNFEQFNHRLDDVDHKLVKLLDNLSPKNLVKKWGKKLKRPEDFWLQQFTGEVKGAILYTIDRHMSEVMSLIAGKELFIMGNDGYPAYRPVRILEEKASIWFHFKRQASETRYYPTIRLRGDLIHLKNQESEVLSHSPAWLLVNQEIFTFEQDVDGKKLKPFLRKSFISIPKSTEETYYRKFVTQLMEKFRIHWDGFDVNHVNEEAYFELHIDSRSEQSLSFKLKVGYGDFMLAPERDKRLSVELEKEGDNYIFHKIFRDRPYEKEILDLFDRITPSKDLMGWEYMEKQKGLDWLSANVLHLRDAGITIVQNSEQNLTFDTPRIEMETEEQGDWFDVRAVVVIGEFTIPFIKFKGHILKGKRDYLLPNGETAILPEAWFSDFRHLVEIAEEKEDEIFSIKKYQAGLLNMEGKGHTLDRIQALAGAREVAEVATPDGLKAELRTYQKKGYDWLHFLKEYNLGGILADDMGLGKTLQTLSLIQQEKENGVKAPSLVVMPTSLLYNWQAEAKRFTPDLKISVHAGLNRARKPDVFAMYDLIFTTYGIVRQDIKMFKKFPFHYIILDESQTIKNPASKTSKAVKMLMAEHRLSLSGTPLENTLMDLWSQMAFLNPGLLGSERFFKNHYVQPIEKEQDEKKQAQLKKIIHPFILRRTKEQVADELPPKVEQIHYCEMEEEQENLYEETKSAYRNYILDLAKDNTFKKKKLNILAGLQKLRQIAIHPSLVEEGKREDEVLPSGKYKQFNFLLEEVLAKKSKVLVFSQFVKLLHIIRDDLTERKIPFAYLDGSTSDRMKEVKRFQEEPDVPVFLISLKAGGVGLNLTAAEYVFILDPWWNPAVESQAVDRSHRIGQKKTVFSYKFITKGTIEEKIVKLQERKAKLSDDVVGVDGEVFKNLDVADLQDLLA